MVIRATYKNGVFEPVGTVRIKEGTVVEIEVPIRPGKTIRVRDLPFVGLWKRRRDIPDGITHVDRLRNQARYYCKWPASSTRMSSSKPEI